MKKFFFLVCFALFCLEALEYEVQFENDQVLIYRVVIGPGEEIGLHRDAVAKMVLALRGGTITRIEEDGRESEVEFPTGQVIYRSVDPENERHRSVNRSDCPIELVMIQMKTPKSNI